MKRLLVVEDEKLIRKGICTIAARSGVPIEEILECSNGEEALNIIENTQIDVMFTDVRMPKMDGIELVHKLKDMDRKPLVVVISGYDDFSYAVEMLRNGVKEYILKPVDRKQIAEILGRFNEEIESQDHTEKIDMELEKQQLRYLLTNDLTSEKEILVLKEKYDKLFFNERFVIGISNIGDFASESEGVMQIQKVGDSNVYIIEENKLEKLLEEEFCDTILGISKAYEGIENIRPAFIEALQARRIAFCVKHAVNYADKPQKISEEIIKQASVLTSESQMSYRLQLIGTDKTKQLAEQWNKLFNAVSKQLISEENFEAIQEKFIEDAARTYRNAMDETGYEKLQSFRHVLSFASIYEYQENFMDFILELSDRINCFEEDSQSIQKIKKAIEYIQQRYNEDINLAVVSNYISMNYSLFSYSFKQYTGTNFVNYIKKLRVDEAKKLLEQTDMKIIEISKTVGYPNEKHFMKLFKLYCGVSPSEYRKNMQIK